MTATTQTLKQELITEILNSDKLLSKDYSFHPDGGWFLFVMEFEQLTNAMYFMQKCFKLENDECSITWCHQNNLHSLSIWIRDYFVKG